MTYVAAYIVVLLVFGILDAVWLTMMGPAFYRAQIGEILHTSVRLAPAIAFYLMYPIGVVVFAVVPALKAESLMTALIHGALFGAIAYATYDLTNHAVMKVWSLQVTLVDIAYGTVASGLAAVVAYLAVSSLSGLLGAN